MPEELLLAAFWRCVLDDLAGRGCTSDSLPAPYRKLPYSERVNIERQNLADEAQNFIRSTDFTWWSHQSGLNPELLRGELHVASVE